MPTPAQSPAPSAWEALERAMAEARALGGALTLLQWDFETYMPPAGGEARGEQLAALQGILHERLVAPALGEALERAESEARGDPDRAAALRELRRDRDRAVRVPAELVRELALAQASGVEAWKAARAEGDFARFAPSLSRLLDLRRRQAEALLPGLARPDGAPAPELYDALLEAYEPGMRVSRLEPILARLVGWLAPLVDELEARPRPDDAFLRGTFDEAAQWEFTLELLDAVGFDRRAGRQDRSVHPFSLGLDPG